MVTPLDPGAYNAGPSKNAAARKSGISAEKIANYLAMAFNMWASVRGAHWEKTADDMALIAEPLATWAAQQDKTTQSLLEKYSLPFALVFGLCMVLQEPIKYEIEYANERRAERDAGKLPGQNGQGQGQAPIRQGAYAGSFNGSAGGNPPIRLDASSLPSSE